MSDAAPTIPAQFTGASEVAPTAPETTPQKATAAKKKGFDVDEYLPNRREAIFLTAGGLLGAAFGFTGATVRSGGAGMYGADRDDAVEFTSRQAKDLLEEGNARFVAGAATRPDQSLARRAVVTQGQNPFAVVLSCADSRVPPEVLFDQGLGDLFVVRSAGEVLDRAVLGSLQYGVDHLATPLLVVLGHSACGAVGATLETVQAEEAATKSTEAHSPSAVDDLVAAIRPSVVEAIELGADEDALLDVAIGINVERVVEQLKEDAVIGRAAQRRDTKVIGAVYDLQTGLVEWL